METTIKHTEKQMFITYEQIKRNKAAILKTYIQNCQKLNESFVFFVIGDGRGGVHFVPQRLSGETFSNFPKRNRKAISKLNLKPMDGKIIIVFDNHEPDNVPYDTYMLVVATDGTMVAKLAD